ncbi:PIG-L family deacetylase [bacterium]|nr:PIG-L family deacetylase [bacterium]
MNQAYPFYPVKRFVTPAPVPYIATEEALPNNQRILVFLPHSDDGRYFGGSLHLLNRRNAVRIVIMSPGFLGVDQNLPIEEKTRLRWEEAVSWAQVLGFKSEQLVDFRADRTYTSQSVDEIEMERLRRLILEQSPTMVFIPNLSDTAQAINYNTRAMVVASLLSFIEEQHRRDPSVFSPLLMVEYPTNHVPILPPSDRNFVIFFNDPDLSRLRREANMAHRSQSTSCFDMTESLVEAVHAISEADTIHYLQKRQNCAEKLRGITVDPRTSRGEHLGMTKLDVKGDTPAIVEIRLEFPLSDTDRQVWNRAVAGV